MKVSNIILAVVLAVGFALPAAVQADNNGLGSEDTQTSFQGRDK